jgi:acylphosphatase
MTATRVIVHGRVQGVFYRNWTISNARELGLTGWVRNCPDGTVEAVLEGEDAEVLQMFARMQSGPPAARVDSIDHWPVESTGLSTFERR